MLERIDLKYIAIICVNTIYRISNLPVAPNG